MHTDRNAHIQTDKQRQRFSTIPHFHRFKATPTAPFACEPKRGARLACPFLPRRGIGNAAGQLRSLRFRWVPAAEAVTPVSAILPSRVELHSALQFRPSMDRGSTSFFQEKLWSVNVLYVLWRSALCCGINLRACIIHVYNLTMLFYMITKYY